MTDILVTTYSDGVVTREPMRKPGSMAEAFDRMQGRRRPRIPPDAGQGSMSPRFFRNGEKWYDK